jgi:Fic-DOC domain mobile mystery protein B
VPWAPIPGETPIDPSGLKINVRNRAQLNYREAENIRKAVLKYLAKKPSSRTAPFDLSWAKQLHKEMFGDVWDWAGDFRIENLNIGVKWEHVETSLETLLGNLRCWDQMPLIEQAARLHYQAVRIHPFKNGNGRWARMLANIWLKLQGSVYTDWPEETSGTAKKSVIRDEYIDAIKQADNGELEPLIKLHRRFTSEPRIISRRASGRPWPPRPAFKTPRAGRRKGKQSRK